MINNIGGYYDDNYVYIPGEGRDEEHQCYKPQLEDFECDEEEYGGIYPINRI